MRKYRWAAIPLALLAAASMIPLWGCVIRGRPAHASVTVAAPAARVQVVNAQPIVAGSVGNGQIAYAGQQVHYPLPIRQPRTVQIYVDGHGLDPTVALIDQFGNRVGYNDDGGSGLDSQLVLTLAPGNYTIQVSGYNNSTGPFTLTVN